MKKIKRIIIFFLIVITLFVVSWLIINKTSTIAYIQRPTSKWGGFQASAKPYEKADGWDTCYRAADDFTLMETTKVGYISWWGGSSDGRHGKTDNIDQVTSFRVDFFSTDNDTKSIGRLLYSFDIPITDVTIINTKHKMYGGGKVFLNTAKLPQAIKFKKDTKYWLSISAYLSKEPRWIWFRGEDVNLEAVIDYGVNDIWGDTPDNFTTSKLDASFILHSTGKLTNMDFQKL